MQGDETENSVIKSLDAIHSQLELYDVVVIIRGGGSKSELSAFDSYNIAFNICQFPLPVISGIGHERDESIVDMVSNISVKTPTAVAELLIDKFFDLFNIIEKQELRLREYIDGLISDEKLRIIEVAREFKLRSLEHIRKNKNILENITHLLNFQSVKIVNGKKQEITLYYEQIRRLTGYYIREQLPRIKIAEVQLEIIISTFFSVQRKQLEFFQLTSEYLHPDRVLERGYSMTYHNGKPIKSVKHIKEDDKVETKLIDGSFSSIVKN
jgi:exodeoxyribonuclease VII large subunit